MSDNNNDLDKEITYEEENNETPVSSFSKDPKTKEAKLKKELKKCQEEKQEYLDGWQRIKADFVNLKKRSEQDKKDFAKYANENFILELLPALDSFDQAFKNKEAWERADANWRTGIEFIYSQLTSVLENHGVKEVSPMGEIFDPQLHHSVEMVEVEDEKNDGKIVEVIQKGYSLGDKTIRHPSVKVGELKK
jgi:molecular chaperone GrpE